MEILCYDFIRDNFLIRIFELSVCSKITGYKIKQVFIGPGKWQVLEICLSVGALMMEIGQDQPVSLLALCFKLAVASMR